MVLGKPLRDRKSRNLFFELFQTAFGALRIGWLMDRTREEAVYSMAFRAIEFVNGHKTDPSSIQVIGFGVENNLLNAHEFVSADFVRLTR